MTGPARRALLAAAALCAAAPAAAQSIDCDRGIVSVGDTKLDLLGKCGEPTLRDARETVRGQVLLSRDHRPRGGQRALSTVETWTYDFGPNRFTHQVTLEGGRVTRIERGSYGYRERSRERVGIAVSRCESSALREGDTKLDLLSKCGEPASADLVTVEETSSVRQGGRLLYGSRTVDVEVWTYNFGPNRLVSLVRLEDGKVVRVESAGYGYAE